MSNEPIYIKVEKKFIDGIEFCETSFHGNVLTLSSLVYSAMLSNPNFAAVIIEASKSYIIDHTDKKAILN